jgi:uncharacterized damage-inducible protein DinB
VNLQDVHELIDYHYWARDRLLDAVDPLAPAEFSRDLGNSFKSIRDTLVHLYSADWVWHSRWMGQPPTQHISSEPFTDQVAIRRLWAEHEALVRTYVAGLDEQSVTAVLEYRLFNGTAGASPVWQTIQHVVNHASYHRGQVVTMLRQLGAVPPKSVDLITFYRERAR